MNLILFISLLTLSSPWKTFAATGGDKNSKSIDAKKYLKWMKKIAAMNYTLPEDEFETMKRVIDWLNDKAFESKDTMWKILEGLLIDCDNLQDTALECEQVKSYVLDWVFADWDANRAERKLQAGGITTDGSVTTFGEGAFSAIDNSTEIPDTFGYALYGNSLEFPEDDLSPMMKRLDGPLPSGLLPEGRKLAAIIARASRAQLAFSTTFETPGTEEYYSAFFSPARIGPFGGIPNPSVLLPEPDVIGRFEEDSEFSHKFLNGVNALSIRKCSNAETELTAELSNFLQGRGISLVDEVSNGNLFYISYLELANLKANPHSSTPEEYYNDTSAEVLYTFHPTMTVFLLNGSDLVPVAIQLESGGDSQVFSRETSSDEEWLVAKMAVANADSQVHQAPLHLGLHLTMEPIIIAIHNVLRLNDHPLWDLLLPVVRDTLFINVFGRNTLFAYDDRPDTLDFVSSIGTAQNYQLIRDRWLKYSFMDLAFDKEIESRGFSLDSEDLPSYYYKQDGAKLWAAYGQFVTDFVNEVYESDAQVASDEILQEWSIETTDAARAAIPGFPVSFESKAVLAETLQVIMWMAGGLHAALNFPQYDVYSFVPNQPFSFKGGMDDFLANGATSSDPRSYIFSDILPVESTPSTILVSWLLTTPTDYPINGLSAHFDETRFGKESYLTFLTVLNDIGREIDDRNDILARQGKPIYQYLHPSVLPASIDI